jgi:1-acyl-sn-glycerol-3-phosphate acyltransferase
MSVRSVGSFSFRYAVLLLYGWLIHRLWYRHIYIHGKENIPRGVPVIFTPNHRNALMDALAVLFAQSKQAAFLARADMFRNPVAASLLTFIKIMPIYRPRDGRREMLEHNDESFKAAVAVMKMGRPLVMFPEGDHGEPKRLRPLKKGVIRIAFQAEETYNFQMNLKIVPVGIDYDHFRFRSSLTVSFGEPIDVDNYSELYRSDPNAAMRSLQSEIRNGIEKLMIHVEDEVHYQQIINLLSLYPRRLRPKKSQSNIYDDKRLIELLEKEKSTNLPSWEQILALLERIREKSRNIGVQAGSIPAWLHRIILPSYHLLLAIAGLPFGIYATINNLPGFLLATRFRRMFKDPQFDATAKFAFGVVILPLIYIAQALVFQAFVHNWAYTGLYFLSLPLGLLFGFHYISFLGKQGVMSVRMLWSSSFFRSLKAINSDKVALFAKLRSLESNN